MTRRRKRRGRRGLYNKRYTPDEQNAMTDAAFAAIKTLYCESLPLWRVCPRGVCRRHRNCRGEAAPCLKRGWPLMSSALRNAAYDLVQAGGPRRVAPANDTERELRHFPPSNFNQG